MSKEPPVRREICVARVSILLASVTSRVRVSIFFPCRLAKVFSDLAVANTRKPLEANCRARALPAPPWEHLVSGRLGQGVWREWTFSAHPVIRIDLCFESDILSRNEANYEGHSPHSTACLYVLTSIKHEDLMV
jgi:hypothetical protein